MATENYKSSYIPIKIEDNTKLVYPVKNEQKADFVYKELGETAVERRK